MSFLHGIFSLSSVDGEILFTLLIRLVVNMLFLYVMIKHIYYRFNGKYKFILSFYLVNLLIFFISSLLASAVIQTGFAFGLFAIFSIIRYRTDAISIKDMTYLFLFIVMAVINSLVTAHVSLYLIIFANLFFLGSVFILEKKNLMAKVKSLNIDVEDIQLVHTDRIEDLHKELRARTGLNILSTEVTRIDYLKDSFSVKAFYKGNNPFE